MSARPITITADALSRAYGDADPAPTDTVGARGQAGPIAQVAIGKLRGEPLLVTVLLPFGGGFPSSVQIQAGEVRAGEKGAPAFDLAWARCLPGGCFADSGPGDDVLRRWRSSGEPGRIAFKDASNREVTVPLSFRGLAQALDALAKEAP